MTERHVDYKEFHTGDLFVFKSALINLLHGIEDNEVCINLSNYICECKYDSCKEYKVTFFHCGKITSLENICSLDEIDIVSKIQDKFLDDLKCQFILQNIRKEKYQNND